MFVGASGGAHHPDGDLIRVDAEFKLRCVKAYRTALALAALGEGRWIAVGAPVSVGFFPPPTSPLYLQRRCRILFSADGGRTWEPARGSEGTGCLRGLAACGPKAAVAVGDAGQILRSEDGGESWQPVARDGVEDFLAAACGGDGLLAAVGRKGAAVVSKDGGKTWKRVSLAANDDLRAIGAAGKFFYVAGGNGAVLRLLPE